MKTFGQCRFVGITPHRIAKFTLRKRKWKRARLAMMPTMLNSKTGIFDNITELPLGDY